MLAAEKYIKAFNEPINNQNILSFLDFIAQTVHQKKIKTSTPITSLVSGNSIYVVSFESFKPIKLAVTKQYRDEDRVIEEDNERFFPMDASFLDSDIYRNILLNSQSANGKSVTFQKKYDSFVTVSSTKLIVRGADYFKKVSKPKGELEANSLTAFESKLYELIDSYENSGGEKIIFYVNLNSLEELITLEEFRKFISEEFLTLEDGSKKWIGELPPLSSFEEEANRLMLLDSLHFIYSKMFLPLGKQTSFALNEENFFETAPKNYLKPTNEKPILKSNRVLFIEEEIDSPQNEFIDFFALCLEKKNATIPSERLRIGTPYEISSKKRLTSLEKEVKIKNSSMRNFELESVKILNPALNIYYKNKFIKNYNVAKQYKNSFYNATPEERKSGAILIPTLAVDVSEEAFEKDIFGILNNNEILKKFNLIRNYEDIGRTIKKEVIPRIGEHLIAIINSGKKNITSNFYYSLRQIPMMAYVFEKEDFHRADETTEEKHRLELQEALMTDISYENIFKNDEPFTKRQAFYSLGLACGILKEKMTNTKNFEKQLLRSSNLNTILRLFNEKSIYINELHGNSSWKINYLMEKINNSIDLSEIKKLTDTEKFLFVTGLFSNAHQAIRTVEKEGADNDVK